MPYLLMHGKYTYKYAVNADIMTSQLAKCVGTNVLSDVSECIRANINFLFKVADFRKLLGLTARCHGPRNSYVLHEFFANWSNILA